MSDRFHTIEEEMKQRAIPVGFSYIRTAAFLASCMLFVGISAGAIAVSLGYKINLKENHVRLEETSTIQVNSPLAGLPIELYLNGDLQSRELPARFSRLEPKQYTIELKRPGYQTWQQVVDLKAYQRAVYNPVVLIYEKVEFKPETAVLNSDSRFKDRDVKNLEVKSGNEIWLNDEFITRTGRDIMSLRWFPGRDFMVIQDSAGLTLLAVDGSYTQRIIAFPQTQETTFFFTEGGRVLYLQDAGVVQRAELYEYTSFIDRLGAVQKTVSP
ncbi:hypothetical protein BH11PAT4_BH11PAT4_2300 [soil metagenome]